MHYGPLILLLVSQLFFSPGGISLELEHHLIYFLLCPGSNLAYLPVVAGNQFILCHVLLTLFVE